MDISKVFVLDSKFPSDYVVSAEGDFLKLLYYDYTQDFGQVSFVNHDYKDYWERGVPVVHLTDHNVFPNNSPKKNTSKVLTVFLPDTVTCDNANALMEKLDELQEEFRLPESCKRLIYVREKTSFGYNYEYYPPMYSVCKMPLFKEAVGMFLRDSFRQSSLEELKMFEEFRSFDLKKMLSDDDIIYSYPVNHNNCGVVIVNSEGERYSSPVTKNSHQQTLNYLLSCMTDRDINDEDIEVLPEKVIEFSTAVLLFREGDVFSYIPEKVSKLQHDELMRIADEIDNVSSTSDILFTTRVLSNGDLVDEELSFRDNVSKSYHESENEKSRGRTL